MVNALKSPDASKYSDVEYRNLLLDGTATIKNVAYTVDKAEVYMARS
jgi:hypothetical protein